MSRKDRTQLTCQYCGKSFYPISGHLKQKTCSKKCGNDLKRGRQSPVKGMKFPERRRAKTKICPICNNEFRALNDTYRTKQKYCSKQCWSKRAQINKNCLCCNKEFYSMRCFNQVYCSRECAFKDKIGSRASAFIDGKANERQKERDKPGSKRFKEVIKARDGYKCRKCGSNERLHTHHIKGWARNPELRFKEDNVITLCAICHGKEHNKDFIKWSTG